jgi:glutathione S-transferase
MAPAVVLRYFPAQGRAQPLRHALADADVPFEDVRVPMAEWPRVRTDARAAGPFSGLPTLSWDGKTLAETLPIATFLGRRLGHYDGLDDVAIAELEAVSSHAYLEILMRAGDLLWADRVYPGVDLTRAAPRLAGRMFDKLDRLDARVPPRGWFGGERPAMPDFFAAEALETTRHVLGITRDDALRARWPRLAGLADRVRARPAIAHEWERRPTAFTVRTDEPIVVTRLRALDLSALGF